MRPVVRPRITAWIVLYALIDVLGMLLFSTGVMWLARRQGLFLHDFPQGFPDALAVTLAGLVLMVWAVSRILRELLKSAESGTRP